MKREEDKQREEENEAKLQEETSKGGKEGAEEVEGNPQQCLTVMNGRKNEE